MLRFTVVGLKYFQFVYVEAAKCLYNGNRHVSISRTFGAIRREVLNQLNLSCLFGFFVWDKAIFVVCLGRSKTPDSIKTIAIRWAINRVLQVGSFILLEQVTRFERYDFKIEGS